MAQGYRKIGGTWRPGMFWRNIGGTWKLGTLWRNIGGVWKIVAPGTAFTPDGGTVTKTQVGTVSVTLSCTTPAVWTYTKDDPITTGVASGGTSNSITFSTSGRDNTQYTATVQGVSNGITRNFVVQLTSANNS